MAIGAMVAVQRMRTLQVRRLMQQHDAWIAAQRSENLTPDAEDTGSPALRMAGLHTQSLFEVMWKAADTMSTRQLELWDDPKGRFVTSDCAVQVPFVRGVRPDTLAADRIWWPISPQRAVSLSNELVGVKATIRKAPSRVVDEVRDAMVHGRDRFIIATKRQLANLPVGKPNARRAQARLRCSQHHRGKFIEPPGCVVEFGECYEREPNVRLCHNGLHQPAPRMAEFA